MLTKIFYLLLCLLLADAAAVVGLTLWARRLKKQAMEIPPPLPVADLPTTRRVDEPEEPPTLLEQIPNTESPGSAPAAVLGPVVCGKIHNIGRRPTQQDCFGVTAVAQESGALAVVADGMGGLADGDRVSQTIVRTLLEQAAQLQPGQMEGALQRMTGQANEAVNQMLGPEGLYRSGSTLVAALVEQDAFHWVSVGDSWVCLYRDGCLHRLNQEHTQLQEWMKDVLNGTMRYEDAAADPDGYRLTSFVGMGCLRYVEASVRRVPLRPADRILLMSDGVYNSLPEQRIAWLLAEYPDVQQAADALEEAILAQRLDMQDNFTAVILGI